MSDVLIVQLQNAEYDCSECKAPHRYTDGTIYEVHQDLMTGNKRWVYEEVDNG